MTPHLHKRYLVAATALLFSLSTYGVAGMRGLHFSHHQHVADLEIACSQCHPNATKVDTTPQDLYPDMGICAECHDVEDASGCALCHVSTTEPPRRDAGDTSETFSHGLHTQAGLECTVCHEDIAHARSASEATRPDVTMCGGCHRKDHLIPADHDSEWEHTHGARAQIDRRSCNDCHAEQDDCTQCHYGDNLTDGTPHPLAFRYNHGPEARMERIRCETCHGDEAFCIECHAAYQVKPLSHDLSGWQSGAHGADARRHLDNCMTCHVESETERTCGSCHN
jgi:hypothetical protein